MARLDSEDRAGCGDIGGLVDVASRTEVSGHSDALEDLLMVANGK